MPAVSTLVRRSCNLIQYGEYIPTEYFVFDEYRLIYISIPKVACTSIKLAIEGVQDRLQSTDQGEMSVHKLLSTRCVHRLSRKLRGYYIISFVRNPFDRLVSCFEDKVRKSVQPSGVYFFSSGYNEVLIRTLFGAKFNPEMTFDEFVRLVAKIPDCLSDGHFKSQYSSLYRMGQRVPHFIGKFENLAEDWKGVASKFGFNELTSSNRTTHAHWKNYYNSTSTIELAYERFKQDIECFGYRDSYEELLSIAK